LKTFPNPATIDWLRSATPISSAGRAANLAVAVPGSNSGERTSGPNRATLRWRRSVSGEWNSAIGTFKTYSHEILCVHRDAHLLASSLPGFPRPVDVPTPAHQHVRQQRQVAGKLHVNPFAGCCHGLHGPASDGRVIIYTCQLRELCFEFRHYLAGKRMVQCASRAEDCVPFRHLVALRHFLILNIALG
jgi:hypothetical protein